MSSPYNRFLQIHQDYIDRFTVIFSNIFTCDNNILYISEEEYDKVCALYTYFDSLIHEYNNYYTREVVPTFDSRVKEAYVNQMFTLLRSQYVKASTVINTKHDAVFLAKLFKCTVQIK